MSIEIKNRVGEVVYSSEEATVAAAVAAAIAAGADMAGWALGGADLSGVNFAGRPLVRVDLRGCALAGCVFDGCDLSGTLFADSDAPGASWAGAQFSAATGLNWTDRGPIREILTVRRLVMRPTSSGSTLCLGLRSAGRTPGSTEGSLAIPGPLACSRAMPRRQRRTRRLPLCLRRSRHTAYIAAGAIWQRLLLGIFAHHGWHPIAHGQFTALYSVVIKHT